MIFTSAGRLGSDLTVYLPLQIHLEVCAISLGDIGAVMQMVVQC